MNSQTICDTPFDIEFVRDKICQKCGVQSKLNNWTVTNEGLISGFLSTIIRLILEWEENEDKLPKNVVMKVPTATKLKNHINQMPTSDEIKVQFESDIDRFIPIAHQNECEIYSLFAHNSPMPLVTVYHSQLVTSTQHGILLMQDMSLDCLPHGNPMSMEQVHNVVQSLAKLHAFSLQDQSVWSGKFKFMERSILSTWPETLNSVVRQLEKLKPEYFEGTLEKIEWCFDLDFLYDKIIFGHRHSDLPEVMAHGDLLDNMLFPKTLDNTPGSTLTCVLDWQTCHPGNIMEDLARVMVSGLPGDIRRKHKEEILNLYYDQLKKNFKNECPFDFEVIKKSYDLIFPYALVFHFICMAHYLSMGTVDEVRLYQTKCAVEDAANLKCNFF